MINQPKFAPALSMKFKVIGIASLLTVVLTACGPIETTRREPDNDSKVTKKYKEMWNKDGSESNFFDKLMNPSSSDSQYGGIGVNSFLWRATLETISFMPIVSADAFGGVIITDWHSSVEVPEERFKLNIFLLGKQLRADGVRVSIFRQVLANGNWIDAEVDPTAERKVEDAILMLARKARNTNLSNN